MGPVPEPERHDTPGLIGEPGPGGTAVIQDVLVTAEDPVGDPVLAQELPDILHRIELWRPWGERHKGDVVRHDQLGRDMPAGAIQENSRMRARRNGLRDLLQSPSDAVPCPRSCSGAGPSRLLCPQPDRSRRRYRPRPFADLSALRGACRVWPSAA